MFIWTGQLFSTLTSSIVGYAIIFWLALETASPEVLSYAAIAAFLPQIVLGLFTGVYIDRWNRKWVMIAADSFIAVCTFALCVLFYLDAVEIWHIYLLSGLRAIGSAFHGPAMQASIPLLAPESQLMRVAGVNQMIRALSSIAGPALGALFITLMDLTVVLMMDVIGAFIACTTLLFVTIPKPEQKSKDERSVIREVKEGLSAIFSQKGLRWLLIFDIVVLLMIIPISILYPLITTQYFGGAEFEMSAVEIVWGIGSLIGGAVIGGRFINRMNKVVLIVFANSFIGLTYFLSGMLPTSGFWYFVILTGISGIMGAIWNGAFVVIMQTQLDHSVLGRAFSTYDSLILLPSVIGLLAAGHIAGLIGYDNALLISGLIIFAMSFALYLIPSVRELGYRTKNTGEIVEKQ